SSAWFARSDGTAGHGRGWHHTRELWTWLAAWMGSGRDPRPGGRRPVHDHRHALRRSPPGDRLRASTRLRPGSAERPGPRRSRRVLRPVIDIARALALSALGTAAFAIVLVLPGVWLADRLVGVRGGVSARLAA